MEALMQALLAMDRDEVRRRLKTATDKIGSTAALETLLIPTMEAIGARWERGEVALSQVYMSGRICEAILDEILPIPPVSHQTAPVAIAVFEDSHALGKRLVLSSLRISGIPVSDYGLGVGLDDLVRRVQQDSVRILLLSVLMLRSALRVSDLMKALNELKERPYVVVGGAPFLLDPQMWKQVGVDAMARNSAEVIGLLKSRLTILEADGRNVR